MKLVTAYQKPYLQTNDGQIINLNTLEPAEISDNIQPVRVGKELKISKHRNNNFLDKAGKIFKISRISKFYGNGWYKLENNIVLFVIIQGDTLQLIGHYPVHYLKLLYRYIIHFNCFPSEV